MDKKIAFIGVGNMATATLTGITSGKDSVADWNNIILYERHKDKVSGYEQLGAYIAGSISEAVELADIILLCVKPQNFPDILPQISECRNVSEKTFVSIAAGITMKTVSDATHDSPVIRVMPNTPMLIGKGVIALCRNDKVSDSDFELVCSIFKSSGKIIVIDESQMNRIISVTGSSPAYVFLMIKAMLEGAIVQGLADDGECDGISQKDLIDCICNAIIGSAELMKSSDKSPDEQIAVVTSKGGTTERALKELEKYSFSEGIVSAMKKCTERADELGSNK